MTAFAFSRDIASPLFTSNTSNRSLAILYLSTFYVTIYGTATCIRKSSQQAVCRFCEALSFAHVGAVPASQVAYNNKFSLMCQHNAQIS
jgi:hypothetical protein